MTRRVEHLNRSFWLWIVAIILSLAVLVPCVWWLQQRVAREQARQDLHRGLEGTWVYVDGTQIRYQFLVNGDIQIRQKLPQNLAPFSGDDGLEFRDYGTWTRDGNIITVTPKIHPAFRLTLDANGHLVSEPNFMSTGVQITLQRE